MEPPHWEQGLASSGRGCPQYVQNNYLRSRPPTQDMISAGGEVKANVARRNRGPDYVD
jgi:hypothetical protein